MMVDIYSEVESDRITRYGWLFNSHVESYYTPHHLTLATSVRASCVPGHLDGGAINPVIPGLSASSIDSKVGMNLGAVNGLL
jgi:hypothetical protein